MKNLTLIIILVLVASNLTQSESSFVSQIPNGSKFSCSNCHPSGNYKSFNSFGSKIKSSYISAGKVKWGAALAALDSDGDGVSNGQELQDPTGVWASGKTNPGNFNSVTNPGDKVSYSSVIEMSYSNEFLKLNSIYPNPVNVNSTINIELKESSFIIISLYDKSGVLIANLNQNYLEAGNYSLKVFNEFEIESLPSDLYLLKIVSGNYFITEKVLILK